MSLFYIWFWKAMGMISSQRKVLADIVDKIRNTEQHFTKITQLIASQGIHLLPERNLWIHYTVDFRFRFMRREGNHIFPTMGYSGVHN